jgi:hypothetical protein
MSFHTLDAISLTTVTGGERQPAPTPRAFGPIGTGFSALSSVILSGADPGYYSIVDGDRRMAYHERDNHRLLARGSEPLR